jgi:hypothetical protein
MIRAVQPGVIGEATIFTTLKGKAHTQDQAMSVLMEVRRGYLNPETCRKV